jgi:hypothetical protein
VHAWLEDEERGPGAPGALRGPGEVKPDGSVAIQAEGLTRRFGDFVAIDQVSLRDAMTGRGFAAARVHHDLFDRR